MQLYCPACQAAFSATQRCPRCGGLLLMPQEAAEAAVPRQKAPPPIPHPTPLGRVAVGALFSLGLYLGLRRLASGALLAAHPDPEGWWSSLDGLLVVCGAQVVAVMFGSLVAAAGRVGGFGYGAIIGLFCGVAFLAAELLVGAPAQNLVLYVQPTVLLLVGGVAGVFAARVWRAVPLIDMPVPDRTMSSSSLLSLAEPTSRARPTAWLRVLIGASVMVAAVAAAEQGRSQAQKYSGGMLRVTSVGQGQFLTWQLAVFGVLLGAATASAGTGAGIRHGLLAGGLGAVGILGVTVAHGEALNPVAYLLNKLSLGDIAPTDPVAIVAALAWVLGLGAFGGWLGNALIQPLAPPHLRQRLTPAYD